MIIYVVDEQGKKIKNADIPITNDVTYENHLEFVYLQLKPVPQEQKSSPIVRMSISIILLCL